MKGAWGIILATARLTGAALWTQDIDFEGMRAPMNGKSTRLGCRLTLVDEGTTASGG